MTSGDNSQIDLIIHCNANTVKFNIHLPLQHMDNYKDEKKE